MRLVAIILLASFGAGCGTGGMSSRRGQFSLEGSLSVVMNLEWDECFIETTSPDEIGVRFQRNKGPVQKDMPLKIVWAQAGQTLTTPSRIVLAEQRPDDPNRQRTTVTRNVLDDKRTTFPLLVRGEMTFMDQIRPDAKVRGQFNMTFENGIEFANGRTVYGNFIATVPP